MVENIFDKVQNVQINQLVLGSIDMVKVDVNCIVVQEVEGNLWIQKEDL